MPDHLSEEDRLGIHEKLLSIDLVRRFPAAFGHGPANDEGREIAVAAALHSIRAAGRDLSTLEKEAFAAHMHAMDAWDANRFRPSEARFEVAVRAGLTPNDARDSHAEFEPAFSFSMLLHAKGWTDFEGNRISAVEVVRQAELRGVLSRQVWDVRSSLAGMKMTDDDVTDLLGLLLSKNRDQPLFHVTDDNKFRLGARDGRDALESVVGAIEPVHEDRSEPAPEDFQPAQEDESTPADLAAENEMETLVPQCVQEWRGAAASDSVEALVADNFERLKSGETSARALAEGAGISRASVDRAVDALRSALARRFGGETPG